jgi:3-deoxy-7-phosphoheptulonate synthase
MSVMIVMHEGATEEQIAHVVARVEEVGASAHISKDDRVTIIGAIGDREELTALPIEAYAGVDRVVAVLKPYKLVARDFHPADSVIEVRGRKIGGGHFALIAGPCSVETPAQVMQAAISVSEAGASMMRGGAFKPRTSPYAFQGLGEEGLELLAAARDRTGLPVVTELTDPRDLDVVLRYADVIQIGARNMQNFQLLSEVGKAGKPVLLKRAPSATVEELLMAAEYIVKEGNRDVILCERGIRTFETATRNTLDISAVPVIKLASHLPVIVDPSHSAGRLDLVLPLSLAAVAAGADGIIVETHPNPETALCDGPQALPSAAFAEYADRVRELVKFTGKSFS